MPLYEYQCQDCNAVYEQLRRMSEADSGLECPVCHSQNVERQLSTFACSGSGPSPSSAGDGCGSRGRFT